MKAELILFDFDGTVIDNSEGIYNCIKFALSKMDMPLPDNITLRGFIGPSLFDSYYAKCEKNTERAEQFVRLYRERFAPVGHTEVRLYPHIKEVLTALKNDGYTLAVCSSKPLEFVIKIAKLLDIYKLFSYYSCPDFATHISDKAGLVKEACRHFSQPEENAVMIGDTKFDIRAAKKAGVRSIGVSYGFSSPGEIENENADYVLSSADEIYTLITGKSL